MPGPYELYLIRHGLAAERGENYPDDPKRPLTSDGMQKLRKEAKGLLALDDGAVAPGDVALPWAFTGAFETPNASASGRSATSPASRRSSGASSN